LFLTEYFPNPVGECLDDPKSAFQSASCETQYTPMVMESPFRVRIMLQGMRRWFEFVPSWPRREDISPVMSKYVVIITGNMLDVEEAVI
jgi:hypothetical protein